MIKYKSYWDDRIGGQSITLFDRVEIWSRKSSWYRPKKWLFGIDHNCFSGCIIVDIAWFGITWLRGDCR